MSLCYKIPSVAFRTFCLPHSLAYERLRSGHEAPKLSRSAVANCHKWSSQSIISLGMVPQCFTAKLLYHLLVRSVGYRVQRCKAHNVLIVSLNSYFNLGSQISFVIPDKSRFVCV